MMDRHRNVVATGRLAIRSLIGVGLVLVSLTNASAQIPSTQIPSTQKPSAQKPSAPRQETSPPHKAAGNDSLQNNLAAIDQLIAAGDLASAATQARQLDQQSDPTIDLTMTMARLGRAFQRSGDLETATDFYRRAVLACDLPAAANLGVEKTRLIRLAAASAMAQSGDADEAITMLADWLKADPNWDATGRRTATAIALRIGASTLAGGDLATAAKAYRVSVDHAGPDQMATAMLGSAWVTAVSQDQPEQAADQLATFINRFPDHADAHRAARACIQCWRQAGREAEASLMVDRLLQTWPDSESAGSAIAEVTNVPGDQLSPAVHDWIANRTRSGNLDGFDAKTTAWAMMVADESKDSESWSTLARHLATIDTSGQSTADLLSQLSDQGRNDAAERLATSLISPAAGSAESTASAVAAGVREAACRWAGRTQRWTMLAMASEIELETIHSPAANRTETVDRLFAESLMQLGRVAEAAPWWNDLVDRRGVTDFATLLRCAESETATGDDADLAGQRISMARAAAEQDPFRIALVDLLSAELSIRRTQFDDARSLLENVVRSGETDAAVRGRAQWLIGETYYLQHQFPEAIEAYRQVEGIDPQGQYASAALVQAGKSFEQLGRTREAAVCYGSLISRFADSPHASVARRRLASIAPGGNPSSNPIRR